MEVKEAIEKVKDKYEGWMGYAMSQKIFNELEEERDEVISLLQQGEAYKNSHIELVKEIKKRQAINIILEPKSKKKISQKGY